MHGFGLARELIVASRESFDLFLVDWVLPDLTGEQVLRWLRVERGNDTPAIFITSRDAEEDIIANAFSAGADDYLIKPPRRLELLSRIEAVLRRAQPRSANQTLVVEPYHFDLARKALTVDGVAIDMTDKGIRTGGLSFPQPGTSAVPRAFARSGMGTQPRSGDPDCRYSHQSRAQQAEPAPKTVSG